MRPQDLVLWCCTLLFIASSSEPRGNSTITRDNGQNNSIMRYQIHTNVTMINLSSDAETVRHNTRENSTKNDDVQYEFHNVTNDVRKDNDSMQYEFHVHSAKDNKSGNQMPSKLRTKANDENNSISHESLGNLMQVEDRSNLTLYVGKIYPDDNKKNIVPYEMCENSTCVLLCCPFGNRFIHEKCIPGNAYNFPFPDVYEYTTNNLSERRPSGKKMDQVFQLAIHDPPLCQANGRYQLTPDINPFDEHTLLANGSLYLSHMNKIAEYCLAVLNLQDKYDITVCFEINEEDEEEEDVIGYPVGLIISLPCLLATFIVYSILPELQNMHGYTLRGYVGSLFVAYIFLVIIQLEDQTIISYTTCIIFGIAYNNNVYIYVDDYTGRYILACQLLSPSPCNIKM